MQTPNPDPYDGDGVHYSEGETVHFRRLIVLAGVVIGIIGLFMKSLVTDGESLLPNLPHPDFPDGIPTIWGGLDTWAQIVLVILIIVLVFLSLRPVLSKAPGRMDSMIIAVIGVALLAYAIVKWVDAGDKADALAAGFAQAQAGGAIPTAFDVARGIGFLVLIVGTVLVIAGGALGIAQNQEE